MSWKLLKAFFEDRNTYCTYPKECFREAYRQKLIEYKTFWLEMADARNRTSHTYNEDLAEKIYEILPKALTHFKELLESIENIK